MPLRLFPVLYVPAPSITIKSEGSDGSFHHCPLFYVSWRLPLYWYTVSKTGGILRWASSASQTFFDSVQISKGLNICLRSYTHIGNQRPLLPIDARTHSSAAGT